MPSGSLRAYLAIARPDHWFKNVFMLAGTAAAVLFPFGSRLHGVDLAVSTAGAFALTCLAASANYVINEVLDAKYDALHPTKRHRPVPSGAIHVGVAWGMAVALGLGSLSCAWIFYGKALTFSIGALLGQGIVYNVPPIRTKEVAFLDVVSESVNNPIRLLIGWYAAGQALFPPWSLFFGYWVLGGFLMTAKRFAEYRFIGDADRATSYRSSFRLYSEESLLITMICYASLAMFFYGVLLVRYEQWDLVLSVPFLTIFLAWFFHLAFRPDSIVKEPERLYEAPAFAAYCAVVVAGILFLVWADLGLVWQEINELHIGPPLPTDS